MIYFLCFLLFVAVVGGKPKKDVFDVIVIVTISFMISVLVVCEYIKL